jgi:hypothetical protein
MLLLTVDQEWSTSLPMNIECKMKKSKAEMSMSVTHRKLKPLLQAQQVLKAPRGKRAKKVVNQIRMVHLISRAQREKIKFQYSIVLILNLWVKKIR